MASICASSIKLASSPDFPSREMIPCMNFGGQRSYAELLHGREKPGDEATALSAFE